MPNLIHLAIPAFIALLLLEVGLAAWEKKDWFETRDTFSSLAMGIGNVLIGLFGKALVLGTYLALYEFRILDLGSSWWVWILAFFGDDLSYYWFHRMSHSSRFLWASHVVHHSSRKYNLATALRQTWTGQLTGTFLFWAWMPLLGFHPLIVMTLQSISLLYQFWIHTEAINKLPGPVEYLFNTPSHHRVHHSSEPIYLDRNHGGILIIWDRIFGTFQEELHHPTYGLTENISSYNPIYIAFHEWAALFRDAYRSRSLSDLVYFVFGPPGWDPVEKGKTAKELRQAYFKDPEGPGNSVS